MEIKQALYNLEHHNKWRRGAEIQPLKPFIIGKSIETIVLYLKESEGITPENKTTTLSSMMEFQDEYEKFEQEQKEKTLEKRTIELTVEQAKELYNGNNKLRNTLLSGFTDAELGFDDRPKSFEELGLVDAWFDGYASELDKKKAIAERKLRLLAKNLNDDELEEDWIDWNDANSKKWQVYLERGDFFCDPAWVSKYGCIMFKREEDLKFSLKYHKELWLDYFKVKR